MVSEGFSYLPLFVWALPFPHLTPYLYLCLHVSSHAPSLCCFSVYVFPASLFVPFLVSASAFLLSVSPTFISSPVTFPSVSVSVCPLQ